MLKQLPSITNAIGLTVHNVSEQFTDVVITFTNGTYLLLHPKNGWDGCEAEIESCAYEVTTGELSYAEAVRVGIVTQEEIDAVILEKDAAYQVLREQEDRAQYERLKAKFAADEVTK